MSLDLVVRNAALPDGRTGVDIACEGGRITAIEPGITGEAARVVEANGRLVSPPFIDCHFHMDATLSLGLPRLNQSGTLLEEYNELAYEECKRLASLDEEGFVDDECLAYYEAGEWLKDIYFARGDWENGVPPGFQCSLES